MTDPNLGAQGRANLIAGRINLKQALENVGPIAAPAQLYDDLEAVFKRNSSKNVQDCKIWINSYIVPFEGRIEALGAYLVLLSRSIAVDEGRDSGKVMRNRLDIILVISDVLHSQKFHSGNQEAVAAKMRPYMEELVELTASSIHYKGTDSEKELKAIIRYWRRNQIFEDDAIQTFISKTRMALRLAQGDAKAHTLPEVFGTSNTPVHALPASYMFADRIRGRDTRLRFQTREPSLKVRELLDGYIDRIGLAYDPTVATMTRDSQQQYNQWGGRVGALVKQDKKTGGVEVFSNLGLSEDIAKAMYENGRFKDFPKVPAEPASLADVVMDDSIDESRSHKRRRRSSSSSDYQRSRSYRSRSYSPLNDRDSRPYSGGGDRPSRDEERRPSRFNADNRQYDQYGQRPESQDYQRSSTQANNGGWQGYNDAHNSNGYDSRSDSTNFPLNQQYPVPNINPQQYPHPQQFLGQYPMQAFPPPFHGPGGPMTGMPAPPNFGDLSASAYSSMGGLPDNGFTHPGYNNGGFPNSGFNNAALNNSGYNNSGYNHAGYDPSGGYGGSYNRGGYQAGNFNNRGNNRGGYRGRGGPRGGGGWRRD